MSKKRSSLEQVGKHSRPSLHSMRRYRSGTFSLQISPHISSFGLKEAPAAAHYADFVEKAPFVVPDHFRVSLLGGESTRSSTIVRTRSGLKQPAILCKFQRLIPGTNSSDTMTGLCPWTLEHYVTKPCCVQLASIIGTRSPSPTRKHELPRTTSRVDKMSRHDPESEAFSSYRKKP